MKLSHSKLGVILSCPMTYHLSYEEGIVPKVEKSALAIGSAVHWGIEHNTEDLGDYYGKIEYTRDQLLAESMVHGYLKHKDELFNEILVDQKTGDKLTLLDENHELFLSAPLKSFKYDKDHEFVGIIDLLLLTDKGFIIVDYKTSSMEPDWDSYSDQLYRYIFLLKENFPDVPINKIAIINLRKTSIRQKKTENESQFLNRLKFEYDLNDEKLVNYHEFPFECIEATKMDNYIDNLSKMADMAQMILESGTRFINFKAAKGQYGKSDYYDIFYDTPDAYLLYKIKDRVWNENLSCFEEYRDCKPFDMEAINNIPLLNHYKDFKEIYDACDGNMKEVKKFIKENKYVYDDEVLKIYEETTKHE